jgi:hypothetical protein
MKPKSHPHPVHLLAIVCGLFIFASHTWPQATAADVERGSRTAKQGFKNEDEIRDKLNNWRSDTDAKKWLKTIGYDLNSIEHVSAVKPHGEKADVEVIVKTGSDERREGISIKLVSSPTGFNQIDKRWLATYAKLWKMPSNVNAALKLFLGETPPTRPGRDAKRMFLTELDPRSQEEVVDFFTRNKTQIISDLFEGDGIHAAGWVLVALKAASITRWTLRRSSDVVKFFAEGPVVLTKQGNLKIGRITMQRKGGDGGRETAKMLQFKINPALLLEQNP